MKYNKHKPLVIKETEVVADEVIHNHEVPNDWVLVDDKPAKTAKGLHYAYLLSRNLSKEKILRNKFYYSTQDTSRVIIPYHMNGNLVNWIARDILGKSDKKYLYPTENHTKNKRSDMVYNYDFANRDELIICEGQFNALIVDGVAVGGKDISDVQLKLIRLMNPKSVILAFDQDAPGKKAIAKSLPQLSKYFKDNLSFLSAEVTDKDFADMGEQEAKQYIKSYSIRYTPASAYTEMVGSLIHPQRKFFH